MESAEQIRNFGVTGIGFNRNIYLQITSTGACLISAGSKIANSNSLVRQLLSACIPLRANLSGIGSALVELFLLWYLQGPLKGGANGATAINTPIPPKDFSRDCIAPFDRK